MLIYLKICFGKYLLWLSNLHSFTEIEPSTAKSYLFQSTVRGAKLTPRALQNKMNQYLSVNKKKYIPQMHLYGDN